MSGKREEHKCTRCGKCCVSSPCFLNKEEVYVEVKGKKIHKCKFLQFDEEGKAKCRAYRVVHNVGLCTSSKRDSYDLDMDAIRQYYKENQ